MAGIIGFSEVTCHEVPEKLLGFAIGLLPRRDNEIGLMNKGVGRLDPNPAVGSDNPSPFTYPFT